MGGKRRVSRTGPALGGWGHGSRGPVPTWVPLEAEETVQGTEEALEAESEEADL